MQSTQQENKTKLAMLLSFCIIKIEAYRQIQMDSIFLSHRHLDDNECLPNRLKLKFTVCIYLISPSFNWRLKHNDDNKTQYSKQFALNSLLQWMLEKLLMELFDVMWMEKSFYGTFPVVECTKERKNFTSRKNFQCLH